MHGKLRAMPGEREVLSELLKSLGPGLTRLKMRDLGSKET